ncbi:UDP-glucose 4-epimerase GalE [Candidatus Nomurabacteria bacterium RIFCSPLOWO2_01_FULL_42_17]|uniref:UDP-glucose 4-epimerase n=1 Tax=Candidatus Nomurabacteria bacterium RIFCSPLOWO2_01_FULL_42_17 TaxID=1801780 RepID=A0A1F6XNC6_9BACT|nr:MAG: UDP-glucose 4-epimerase GalE [Candidatus Nomurabacteria bacterium RIFCSPLOWO2_01_FULL_42_17]
MKILVTGGFGYIGAHFINRLKEHEILVVENFCQGRNNVIEGIQYKEVDIRNKEKLLEVFREFRPDIVVHYAALANVPDSVANPAKYYDTNIIGSLNVLECMREVGCKKIIFSSTAAVYGQSDELINEDHPKNPTSPYGHSKLMFEQILKDYHRAYGISSVSFRYFCASGCDEGGKIGCYHDPETQAIPNLVKTLLGKQEIFNVWGGDFPTPDGTGVRDYIHVNDLADAHILAIKKLEENGCFDYNLGINKGFSVMELIKEAERVTGKKLNYKMSPRRAGDPATIIASSMKAQKELRWTPKYTDIGEIILTDYNFFKTQ